jgi:hypothetical protein
MPHLWEGKGVFSEIENNPGSLDKTGIGHHPASELYI